MEIRETVLVKATLLTSQQMTMTLHLFGLQILQYLSSEAIFVDNIGKLPGRKRTL